MYPKIRSIIDKKKFNDIIDSKNFKNITKIKLILLRYQKYFYLYKIAVQKKLLKNYISLNFKIKKMESYQKFKYFFYHLFFIILRYEKNSNFLYLKITFTYQNVCKTIIFDNIIYNILVTLSHSLTS